MGRALVVGDLDGIAHVISHIAVTPSPVATKRDVYGLVLQGKYGQKPENFLNPDERGLSQVPLSGTETGAVLLPRKRHKAPIGCHGTDTGLMQCDNFPG